VNPDVVCLQEIKASGTTPLLDFELAGYPYLLVSKKRDIVE
jgi:exonuclease III